MHYILGQNLYKTYWDQLFSGTPYYNIYNQSKIYVKSTNVNRTIQSVQSQLLGIFENVDKLTLSEKDVPYSLPQWTNVNRQAGTFLSIKAMSLSSPPFSVLSQFMSKRDILVLGIEEIFLGHIPHNFVQIKRYGKSKIKETQML